MSYVIQNYNVNQINNFLTPRLKITIFFKKFKLFILFFKFKFFIKMCKSNIKSFSSFQQKIAYHFYYNFYFKFIKFFFVNSSGFYLSNLSNITVFFCIKALAHSLQVSRKLVKFFDDNDTVNTGVIEHQQYRQSVTIIGDNLSLNNFKNFFFFKFFFLAIYWYQHNLNLKFYLNFTFSVNDLFVLPIFSGFFFKIYRF